MRSGDDELAVGPLEQLLLQARARPAAEDAPVLRADDEQRVERPALARRRDVLERRPRATRSRSSGVARRLVDDQPRRLAREQRATRVSSRRDAPTAQSRALGERHARPCPGCPCAARSSRRGMPPPTLRTVELQRAADRRVRAVALAERVALGVHPGLERVRPADHDDRPDRRGGRDDAVQRERLPARRLDRRQHDRQLRPGAAGHHGVDRHLLDGRRARRRAARRRPDPADGATCARAARRRARASAARPAGRRSARARAAPRTGPRARRSRARARRSGRRRVPAAPRAAARRPGRACARRSRAACAGRPSSARADQRREPVALQALDAVAHVAVLEQEHGRHRRRVEPLRERELLVDLRHAREPEPRACSAVSSGEDCETSRTPAASSAGSTWSQTGQSCLTSAISSRPIQGSLRHLLEARAAP